MNTHPARRDLLATAGAGALLAGLPVPALAGRKKRALRVAYFCDGAVHASWWNGDYQECSYGYAAFDLFDDGTFTHEYVPYGWKTQA